MYRVKFEAATGAIRQVQFDNGDRDRTDMDPWEIMSWPNRVHPDTHYVRGGTDIANKTMFPELRVHGGRILGLPAGTIVVWPDYEQTIEGGEISISSNIKGVFKFTFYHAAHITHELEIEI